MNRASSLGISDAAIIIRYGPLTDKLNADLTDSVKLDLDAGSVHCFDIATLNEGKDALDCYDFDTKQDFIYIFNHEDKTLTPFNFENTIFTSCNPRPIQKEKLSLTTFRGIEHTSYLPLSPKELEPSLIRPLSESTPLIKEALSRKQNSLMLLPLDLISLPSLT